MTSQSPYHIAGPAIIAVSGGRTSGFMLRQILDAHGGKLPADVVPVFNNTGREHEATLKFVKEIGERWCPVVWLEYRHDPHGSPKHTFVQVDYCTASRNGEPFEQLISARSVLPNPVMRMCSGDLKIKTTNRFAGSLGWESWTTCLGLRYDEPRRVAKARGDKEDDVACPMYAAKHTRDDVMRFWKGQAFDLELPGNDNAFGNCDLCFLKSRAKIEKVIRSRPDLAEWWAAQEERMGSRFRKDRPSYRQLLTQVTVQGQMFDDAIEDDTLPCSCTE